MLAAGVDARTGGSLILGSKNSAGNITTLRNTGSGPALALMVKQGQPPLSVSSGVVVPRLNASLLNGKRAASFAPASGSPNYARRGTRILLTEAYDQPTIPAGGQTSTTFRYVTAPASGTLHAMNLGTCTGHGFITIGLAGNSRTAEIGDGGCGLEHSIPVTLGQPISLFFQFGTYDGFEDSLAVASGTWSLWVEPS